MAKKVKKERNGKRDLALNNRHREYGYDCPAVDLDNFLEYDSGEPAALIEYKFIKAPPVDFGSRTIMALECLATRACIPAFIAWYYKKPWRYWVVAMNSRGASAIVGDNVLSSYVPEPRLYTERDFVRFLYQLRDRTLPFDQEAKLDDELTGNEFPPKIKGNMAC